MPVIKEEDLVQMHKKIEDLEKENKDTNQFYKEKEKRLASKQKQQKTIITVLSCVALLAIIGAGALWFFKIQGQEPKIVEKVVEKIVEVEVPSKNSSVSKPNFYYSAQIGAFKNLNVAPVNINVYTKNGYNEVLIGVFNKYKDSKDFTRVLEKLGFEDAYVVALQNGEKIPIEEALKISKEEGAFLEYRKREKGK